MNFLGGGQKYISTCGEITTLHRSTKIIDVHLLR